jgi:glycosyltransferase involved in cell wall biosynthesis
MARIGIDARKYFDFGIGTYIQELTRALHDLHPLHSFVLFVAPADVGRIPPMARLQPVVSRYGKYSIGEWLWYARTIRQQRVDVFHEPHYTLPAGLRGKSVVTIHDLIHLIFPEYFSASARSYAWLMMRHAVQHSGAIIAVSECTKRDLVEHFGVREETIHVIYNGVGRHFRRLDDQELLRQFITQHALRKPFLLYVGGLGKHKNIPVLLKAFRLLQEKGMEMDLVFAGKKFFDVADLAAQAHALGITQAIRDLGPLENEHLVTLYNLATVVVVPSLYEGFGFPALEAMACGTPVVVSDRGALPEVAGNAALIFEAKQPESLAAAVEKICADSHVRDRLIEQGKQRAAAFSWEDAARKTAHVYESLL